MTENQTPNPNAPRKLRKIKRVRPAGTQPTSYGMPSKINTAPTTANSSADLAEGEILFNNNGEAKNIRFITEEELYPTETGETISHFLKNKTVLLLLTLAGLVGIIIGATMFSTRSTAKGRGLDGVVFNQDVPAGRSRCGLVEPHQGCVLYIMNPKNQEVTGKDFYTTAAQWTQRQRYLIETGNMHYSSVRIKPGYIAQINIPPLSSQ